MASPWCYLALPAHPPQPWVFQDWCPKHGCPRPVPGIPRHSSQAESSVLLDNASTLCVLRAPHIHARAPMHMDACTHTPSVDVCVLTRTPASPRDSPSPMLQRTCTTPVFVSDPRDPAALAALLLGALLCPHISTTQSSGMSSFCGLGGILGPPKPDPRSPCLPAPHT